MATPEPLYLMFGFDTIYPEDDKYTELSADEYRALAAYGRSFNHDDFDQLGDNPTALGRLLSTVIDQRDRADRRPSEIEAAEQAGTVLYCQMNI